MIGEQRGGEKMNIGHEPVLVNTVLSPEIAREMKKGIEYAREHAGEFPPEEIMSGVGFVLYATGCGGC